MSHRVALTHLNVCDVNHGESIELLQIPVCPRTAAPLVAFECDTHACHTQCVRNPSSVRIMFGFDTHFVLSLLQYVSASTLSVCTLLQVHTTSDSTWSRCLCRGMRQISVHRQCLIAPWHPESVFNKLTQAIQVVSFMLQFVPFEVCMQVTFVAFLSSCSFSFSRFACAESAHSMYKGSCAIHTKIRVCYPLIHSRCCTDVMLWKSHGTRFIEALLRHPLPFHPSMMPLGCPLQMHVSESLAALTPMYDCHGMLCIDVSCVYCVHVYIDGGYDGSTLHSHTFGLVAVATCVPFLVPSHFIGTQGAPIAADFAYAIGLELLPDSFAPELAAQILAHVFIIQHLPCIVSSCCSVIVHYDNMSANHVVSRFHAANTQPLAANFARLLRLHALSIFPLLSDEHVKSHTGNPLNDAADSICNFYKTRPSPVFWRFPRVSAYLVKCLDFCINQFPVLLRYPVVAGLIRSPTAQKIDSAVPSVEGSSTFKLYCVQYNVCTLKSHSLRTSLTTLLRRNKGFACFIQEARFSSDSIFVLGGYIIATSAADMGNYSCAILISTSIP